ncbi:hypothetical protein E3N88_30580 [Mikania micrantha]|uniref:Reverse transcriptase Ty1/copia-type domain-containing protein n=1 Tax=Mikania micrantha TaxID=192012 RepID=A0A5N6MMS6_9ASTR|nr:hypothetical protein E3N88_30580 [Mikania micrantha]
MLMVTDDKLSGMSPGTKHLYLPCRKLHAYDNGVTASDQASFLTKLRLYFSDVHEHVFLTKCARKSPEPRTRGYDISEMDSGHNKTDSLVRDSDDIYKIMDGSVLHTMELTDVFSPVIQIYPMQAPSVEELGIEGNVAVLKCDNMGAIQWSKHQVFHERSKHINVKLHFVRDIINSKVVQVEYVNTSENLADMLTKSLPSSKFDYCCDQLQIC